MVRSETSFRSCVAQLSIVRTPEHAPDLAHVRAQRSTLIREAPPCPSLTPHALPCMPTQSWGHGIIIGVTQSDGSKSVHDQVVLECSAKICEYCESLTQYTGIKLRSTYIGKNRCHGEPWR